LDPGRAHGVVVRGNHVFAAIGHGGLAIIDVSDAANPQRVGGYATSGYAYDVAVMGNHAYVADWAGGLQKWVGRIANVNDLHTVSPIRRVSIVARDGYGPHRSADGMVTNPPQVRRVSHVNDFQP
jgi:hypothetical protein